MQPATLLLVTLLSPLVSAGLIWLLGRRRGGLASALSVGAAGVLAVSSLALLLSWDGTPLHFKTEWLSLGSLQLNLGFYLTPVSALMLFVVGFVGFWIHVFSLGYMHDDEDRGRFFGGLSIFMFSMLGIVLADSLFMLFIFWELVGFSSYMLIGHYLKKDEAAQASKKAFIVNRVGDFGLLLGIILIWSTFGTTDLVVLEGLAGQHPEFITTALGLLLFCGVLGKSAQMPLHVWLPDAMAGPTPISALIHAATMVAAGVFLLARTAFVFTPDALQVVGWVGTVTALSAALWAFAQSDIKKILAYSTLSQLGFMVAAFGFGTLVGRSEFGLEHFGAFAPYAGIGAAMFHLTTHAFFKALMFLGSGSVIHACHHEQDIFKMGGLLKRMPITAWTFAIGVVAIAGVPFVAAGFFSKDAILLVVKYASTPAFAILCFTAFLTATYMGRLFVIAFLGEAKSEAAAHAHESPWVMWLPLAILAVCSLAGGHAAAYPGALGNALQYVPKAHGADHGLLIGISAAASILGLVLAFVFYKPGAATDALQVKAGALWKLSKSRFYFDEVYGFYVAKIQQRLAEVVAFLDQLFIGGLMVRGSAGVVGLFGLLARSCHTGSIHTYVWWFFGGLVIFIAYALHLFPSIF